MIPYTRNSDTSIPTSSVKIVGLGGAGANMLERIALDGMEGTELLSLNTDIRTLNSCIAKDKIQLGTNLTKGLGAGGDPELGQKAVLEAEAEVRAALKGRKIVFLCTGLGGGTGSGAAPIVTRIAREEGAFVVVFATIPFAFEGNRRREQAETALNELAVLSNALVTFDNNRMGELVLAKQGIHEAFVAADNMISESIKAVIRLVVRPGLINVGLDDLMSALKTNRSRCLFGSGIAEGKDRASKALRSALSSPLLDQGSLLKEAQTVLVHLCGGEDLTLYEVELLMQQLQKYVPQDAHVLFGAAVDPSMGDSLSITLISALPEEALAMAPRTPLTEAAETATPPAAERQAPEPVFEAPAQPEVTESKPEPQSVAEPEPEPPAAEPEPPAAEPEPPAAEPEPPAAEPEPQPAAKPEPPAAEPERSPTLATSPIPAGTTAAAPDKEEQEPAAPTNKGTSLFQNERPFAEAEETPRPTTPFGAGATSAGLEKPSALTTRVPTLKKPKPLVSIFSRLADVGSNKKKEESAKDDDLDDLDDLDTPDDKPAAKPEEQDPLLATPPGFQQLPDKRPAGTTPMNPKALPSEQAAKSSSADSETKGDDAPQTEVPKLKLGVKVSDKPQSELGLDATPRGRFDGENPNVVDGEDLDLPPFLRKKK